MNLSTGLGLGAFFSSSFLSSSLAGFFGFSYLGSFGLTSLGAGGFTLLGIADYGFFSLTGFDSSGFYNTFFSSLGYSSFNFLAGVTFG